LRHIIRDYTREAGVRNVEREIATICRKVARRYAEGTTDLVTIDAETLATFLGPARFDYGMVEEKEDQVGAATGVSVSEYGGDVPMTGEITLRGKVLPIGGVKEKLLAAHRAGIKTFILPQKNKKDLVDVPKEVQDEVDIKLVSDVSEVLQTALQQPVVPSRAD